MDVLVLVSLQVKQHNNIPCVFIFLLRHCSSFLELGGCCCCCCCCCCCVRIIVVYTPEIQHRYQELPNHYPGVTFSKAHYFGALQLLVFGVCFSKSPFWEFFLNCVDDIHVISAWVTHILEDFTHKMEGQHPPKKEVSWVLGQYIP